MEGLESVLQFAQLAQARLNRVAKARDHRVE
jgi:hypothetical protein